MSFTIQKQYATPARVLIPVKKKINGVIQKTFEEGEVFFCSAKSYGGTEGVVNNLWTVQDTMEIECYFREDIKRDCNLKLLDEGSVWEILATPENIERKGKTLKFKVKRVVGNG